MSDAPTPAAPSASTEAAHAQFFDAVRASLAQRTLAKLVLAGPRGAKPDLLRVLVRPLMLKRRACLSLTHHHRSKDVTKNLPEGEGLAAVAALLDSHFDNLHLITTDGGELQLAISRKGKATLRRHRAVAVEGTEAAAAPPGDDAPAPAGTAHDRAKQRPVDVRRPWLTALGVTDAQQRLVPAMARKWKQINKFIEVLAHAVEAAPALAARDAAAPLRVLDFGAGKGYLTFAVHDHLSRVLGGRPLDVTGIDLKDDMVALGNATAQQLGLQGLRFEQGDVGSVAPRPVDIVIALHACDTATDHAMHRGIRAGAAIIMCSPCCHKELRPHGLRALLLDAEGYDTQVFEFTSLEHTSKNKMILAVRRAAQAAPTADAVHEQIGALKAFYGVQTQCLEGLLAADRPASAAAPA